MTEVVAFQAISQEVEALALLEGGAALTRTYLHIPSDITTERYEALGRLLTGGDDSIQWAWGCWFAFGEEIFPEEHSQLWEAAGVDPHRAMQYIRVHKAIPEHARRNSLTWTHHRTVYNLDDATRDHWLLRAENEGWTATRLADELRESRSSETNGSLPAPSRSYVLERVSTAAEAVWKAAEVDGDFYRVPAADWQLLGEALGAA